METRRVTEIGELNMEKGKREKGKRKKRKGKKGGTKGKKEKGKGKRGKGKVGGEKGGRERKDIYLLLFLLCRDPLQEYIIR
jgi:hypothetical protein